MNQAKSDRLDEDQYDEGSAAGAQWAKKFATPDELDRLAEWSGAQMDYVLFTPELVARILVPNTLARDFWKKWQDQAYPSMSYVAGFVEGALENAEGNDD